MFIILDGTKIVKLPTYDQFWMLNFAKIELYGNILKLRRNSVFVGRREFTSVAGFHVMEPRDQGFIGVVVLSHNSVLNTEFSSAGNKLTRVW